MNFFKKLKQNIVWLFLEFRSIKVFANQLVYILDVPTPGNLGDQAIIEAEKKLLKNQWSDIKIVEVSSYILDKPVLLNRLQKKIKKQDIICMQGGGSLDDRAWKVVTRFIQIFELFPDHQILVFPQTISFSQSERSQALLENLKKSVAKHGNIILFARELRSYECMKRFFPSAIVYKTPDMVFYLSPEIKEISKKKKILCFLRQDKEKTLHKEDEKLLQRTLAFFTNYSVIYSDTVLKNRSKTRIKNVYWYNRKFKLRKKWKEIQQSKLIITDRLHGMIFGYINHTPVILLPSLSPKIKGVYQWVSNCKSIVYLENIEKLKSTMINLLENRQSFDIINFSEEFEPLKKALKGVRNESKK